MNIVIVGLGVVGGSFAMSLKEAGYENVYGVDTDEETLRKAKEQGIIKEGCTEGNKFFKQSDITIISIYPKLIKTFVDTNKEYFKKNSIITDVTGVKEMLIDEILEILPTEVDFVFGHPMAGREKKGIDFASAEVFRGANYIITPIERNKPENIDIIEKLVYDIGFARVNRITPKIHDELIGFTSQLPHAMAVALINSDEEERDTGSFIGDSYRDLTRIANINEELWSELFLWNKVNLLKAIKNFEYELDLIKKSINDDDKESLMEYFRKSTRRRENLEEK